MKRFFIVLFILALAIEVFPQQNRGLWNSVGKFDTWAARKDSTLETTIYVADATVYTEVMLSWPYMGLDVVVGDSSSATDSISYAIDLYMWHQYRAQVATDRTADKAKFCYVKTLSFNTTSVTAATDSISAAGAYQAMITDDPIPPATYYRFGIRPLTGAKTGAGNYFQLNPIVYRE